MARIESESGVEIVTFDSAEDMVNWVASQREAVDKRVLAPVQQGLTFGGYAVRFWENLVIFNHIPTLEEQAKIEEPEVIDSVRVAEQRDMLWCKSYSTVCVEGEYGYHHRSVLWPITKETFDAAFAVHWDVERLNPINGLAHLSVQSAYFDLRNWAMDHPDRSDG